MTKKEKIDFMAALKVDLDLLELSSGALMANVQLLDEGQIKLKSFHLNDKNFRGQIKDTKSRIMKSVKEIL